MKHANYNKGQGIRANSGKSEGGNLELTSCTHTQIVRAYLRDENVLHHTSKEETHVAILGVTVVIAFSLATCGAFSVSSTAECLKDSELVRKDTELRLNIPEIFSRHVLAKVHG